MQAEVGIDGYDKGSAILTDFFKNEIEKFNTPQLHPLGKQIIECFLSDASLKEYLNLMPIRSSSILLGILGIIAGITGVPIKILSFPPLIWTVLLFGIFIPFVSLGIKNIS